LGSLAGLRQSLYHFLEHLSPMVKALKLVETGARWGQQDDIAGLSNRSGTTNGIF